MALGDRSEVASDTFATTIDSNWDNPSGNDMGALTHVGSGQIEPSAVDALSSMRRNTATYADPQYGTVTVGTNHGSGGANFAWVGGTVRHASGATDDSHYAAHAVASNTVVNVAYRIAEYNSAGGQTIHATTGTDHDLAAGDTVTLEANGSDLELFTDESGGGDTSRLSTTDATLTSGRPGAHAQKQVSGDAQITAWSGGDLVAGARLLLINPPGLDGGFSTGLSL